MNRITIGTFVLSLCLLMCNRSWAAEKAKWRSMAVKILKPQDMEKWRGRAIKVLLKERRHASIPHRIDLSRLNDCFGTVEQNPIIGAVPFFRIHLFIDADLGQSHGFIDVGPWFLKAYALRLRSCESSTVQVLTIDDETGSEYSS